MFTEREHRRIFSKVSIDPDTNCWNWTGGLSDGYGRIYWRGFRYKAHRLFYFWKHKNLPKWEDKKSLEIDHLCNNRKCVNPDHLHLTTPRINNLRGNGAPAINYKKTHCIHGHDSLYKVGNRRRCRECRRILDSSNKRKQWRKNWIKNNSFQPP